ncbi:MAG: BolA/IbaG family iron-sulfur metabolism protein [Cellvibrionaceae bacterium]
MIIQKEIESILDGELAPSYCVVENESYQHSVPENSETHFKVIVVSDAFKGVRQVQRHQKIYQLLAAQLKGPVHALALHTFAPEEWEESQQVADSPNCLGGSKVDEA